MVASIDFRNATTRARSRALAEPVGLLAVRGAVLHVADHALEGLAGAVVVVGRQHVEAQQRRHVVADSPAVAVVVLAERVRLRARHAGRVHGGGGLLGGARRSRPSGFGPPGTPRLNEPMSRRKRVQVLGPDRRAERRGRSRLGEDLRRRRRGHEVLGAQGPLAAHVAGGAAGLREQRPPRLHVLGRQPVADALARERGPRGVRTASLTHSRSARQRGHLHGAARQRDGVLRAARRSACAKAFITHGARLMLPSSPKSKPWFGSNALVAGGGALHGSGAASGAGAGHVADVRLEVLDLVEDRRVVEDPLLVAGCAG